MTSHQPSFGDMDPRVLDATFAAMSMNGPPTSGHQRSAGTHPQRSQCTQQRRNSRQTRPPVTAHNSTQPATAAYVRPLASMNPSGISGGTPRGPTPTPSERGGDAEQNEDLGQFIPAVPIEEGGPEYVHDPRALVRAQGKLILWVRDNRQDEQTQGVGGRVYCNDCKWKHITLPDGTDAWACSNTRMSKLYYTHLHPFGVPPTIPCHAEVRLYQPGELQESGWPGLAEGNPLPDGASVTSYGDGEEYESGSEGGQDVQSARGIPPTQFQRTGAPAGGRGSLDPQLFARMSGAREGSFMPTMGGRGASFGAGINPSLLPHGFTSQRRTEAPPDGPDLLVNGIPINDFPNSRRESHINPAQFVPQGNARGQSAAALDGEGGQTGFDGVYEERPAAAEYGAPQDFGRGEEGGMNFMPAPPPDFMEEETAPRRKANHTKLPRTKQHHRQGHHSSKAPPTPEFVKYLAGKTPKRHAGAAVETPENRKSVHGKPSEKLARYLSGEVPKTYHSKGMVNLKKRK